ncbi:MAG: U32 family peptidase [Saezia sp.]
MKKDTLTKKLQLSLGPILFFWTKEQVYQFYKEVADQSLHTIYLGETVCARRYEIKVEDWIALARDLASTGKEIVLSTQVLTETEIDLRRLRKLVEQGEIKIEANDLGAAKLAHDHGLPFVAGQTLNIYNEDTLRLFQNLGAMRWVAPAEISAEKVKAITEQTPDMPCEVFGWGFVPLAFSARCFTARYYNLRKDLCEFKCQEFPDAMLVKTREDQEFLRINGIETMSAGCQALIMHQQQMIEMGVDMFRLSPQLENMPEIIRLHHAALSGQMEMQDVVAQLKELALGDLVDGFWRGEAGSSPVIQVK